MVAQPLTNPYQTNQKKRKVHSLRFFISKHFTAGANISGAHLAFIPLRSIQFAYASGQHTTHNIQHTTYNIQHLEEHVWHLFVIRTSEREKLQNYLTENGVQTLIHYPIPPHKQEAYKEMNHLSFPITEKIHQEVVSLPISPVMGDMEVDIIISVLNKF